MKILIIYVIKLTVLALKLLIKYSLALVLAKIILVKMCQLEFKLELITLFIR